MKYMTRKVQMETKEVTISVNEEMFFIIASALLKNLTEAEKLSDHVDGCEFATDRVMAAAMMFHSFVSQFD